MPLVVKVGVGLAAVFVAWRVVSAIRAGVSPTWALAHPLTHPVDAPASQVVSIAPQFAQARSGRGAF